MGRSSKIKRLPPEIRQTINEKLDAGWTLDDIVAHLKTLDVDVSRSGVHRYSQHYEEVAAQLRTTRAAAEALARDLGAVATDDASRLLIELLQSLMFKTAGAMSSPDTPSVGTKDLHDLAKAFDHLARAKGKTVDIEKAARLAANAAAAETAAKAVAEAGLSAATVDAIKNKILGQAA